VLGDQVLFEGNNNDDGVFGGCDLLSVDDVESTRVGAGSLRFSIETESEVTLDDGKDTKALFHYLLYSQQMRAVSAAQSSLRLPASCTDPRM
jgi:hypothetical protein